MRILLADDIESNREMLKLFLARTPCEIDEAANCCEAFELFKAKAYDLVVMDIAMPGMDGNEATLAIRAFEAAQGQSRTPILAISAHAFDTAVQQTLAAGCDAYLIKPVSKKVFLAAIAEHTGAAFAPGASPATVVPIPPANSSAAEIVVEVNPALRPLAQKLVQVFEGIVGRIATALAAGDSEQVAREAHGIKGAAMNFGIDIVAGRAREVEIAAKAADLAAVAKTFETLQLTLKRLRIV